MARLWGRKLPEGASAEHERSGVFAGDRVSLDAPDGMIWAGRELHCVVVCRDDIDEVLREGLTKCENADCEYCDYHPPEQ